MSRSYTLKPWERERFGFLFERTRMAARPALEKAKTAATTEEALDALDSIVAGSNAAMEREVTAAFTGNDEGRRVQAQVACRQGCSFCCYVNVEVSIIEALRIARHVGRDPALTRAARDGAKKSAGLDAWQRVAKRLPCTFLKGHDCGIYEVRPRSCRAYLSLDAKRCETALEMVGTKVEVSIPVLDLPRVVGTAFADGIRAACKDAGLQGDSVELTKTVAQILDAPDLPDRWRRGESVFTAFA